LYPEGVKKDKVLLSLSDAAPYMKKAVEVLQIFYQNIIHVTCLAHGLHRICETIREEFPAVNKLISSTKLKIKKSLFTDILEGTVTSS
jgi:hypothetical protein